MTYTSEDKAVRPSAAQRGSPASSPDDRTLAATGCPWILFEGRESDPGPRRVPAIGREDENMDAMNVGLQETFQFLAKTENEAAVDVLAAGLDCPHKAICDRSLQSLLTRSSPRGHHEIFRRLARLDKRCRSIIGERPERLMRAAGAALQSLDGATCAAALEGIVSFRLYDTIPALVARLTRKDAPNLDLISGTILKLTEQFYAELSDPKRRSKRNDLEKVRRRVTSALEVAVSSFDTHRRREPLEAFLLVAKQQNVTLRRVLREPHERSREALIEVISSSTRGGVIRLLLGFLEDPRLPQAVKSVLANRTDVKFVENLLQKTGPRPSGSVAKTLARIDSVAWASPRHPLFKKLDGAGQYNAVQLLMATSMDRGQLFDLLQFLLLEGKPGGRRGAAQRLAEFEGAEADALAVKALDDEDPGVRAHLVRQIPSRQIPGAMSLLIGMVDTPHEEVREALREAMPEFTYQQFMTNFESLPEELLPTAGHLVWKIDTDVRPRLIEDMESRSRLRRRRAVLAAGAMGLVGELEQSVIERLSDEDHMVRVAAANVLAECETMPSWEALRDALFDRSVAVQEAAEQSLMQIRQSLQVPVEEEEEAAAAAEEEVVS